MTSKRLSLCVLAALALAPLAWSQAAAQDPHLAKAIELRAQAVSDYGSGDYDAAADLARQAKAELALVQKPAPAGSAVEAPAAAPAPLPASYTVRLIPSDRDCLSKIAGYPFVYGDRSLWTTIYRANKTTLKHPENADIILPGEVLVIPSLKGETREGAWEDGKDYPSFKAPN
jgi:nucleoid-associated protein YgaU